MNVDTLVPVATLVLGYVGSLVTESRRDKRQRARDEEARAAERAMRIDDRRVAFQRETLLELQLSLQNLARASGRISHEDYMSYKASVAAGTPSYGRQQLSEGWSERENEATTSLLRLAPRVADNEVRSMTLRFREQCHDVGAAQDPNIAMQFMEASTETLRVLQERIGYILRTDYWA